MAETSDDKRRAALQRLREMRGQPKSDRPVPLAGGGLGGRAGMLRGLLAAGGGQDPAARPGGALGNGPMGQGPGARLGAGMGAGGGLRQLLEQGGGVGAGGLRQRLQQGGAGGGGQGLAMLRQLLAERLGNQDIGGQAPVPQAAAPQAAPQDERARLLEELNQLQARLDSLDHTAD